jgi:hypothetical protein
MTPATKVNNTTIVQLMKTNNSYVDHFSIRQSDGEVVHILYNLEQCPLYFHDHVVRYVRSMNKVTTTSSDRQTTKIRTVAIHDMCHLCVLTF